MHKSALLTNDFFEKNIEELIYDSDLNVSPLFKQWMTDVIFEAYNLCPTSEPIIIEKLTHIFSTVLQGRRIIKGNINIPVKNEVADLCFLLHDIGRFQEAVNNEHLIKTDGFDHADYGSRILLESSFPDFPILEENKDIISDSIRVHDKPRYKGNNIYAKLVRDADKLDNLININFQMEFSESVLNNNDMSDSVFKKFCNKELITPSDIKSEPDYLIFLASWLFDINFLSTKVLIHEEKIKENITKYLSRFRVEKHYIDKINSILTDLDVSK